MYEKNFKSKKYDYKNFDNFKYLCYTSKLHAKIPLKVISTSSKNELLVLLKA